VKDKGKHEDDGPISVSLETLAHHILETPRDELAALRAAFDRQISAIEARLDASTHQAAIDATGKIIADLIGERVESAQQLAETDLTQALAVNTMLRKALDNAQQQAESAQADLAAAETDRKALAAQHREALNDKKKLTAELTNSQQQIEELASERVELQRKLKDVTAAKAIAESQYQQLAAASQKLTDGLSRTLHGQREQVRPIAAAAPKKTQSADTKGAASTTRLSATPSKSTPVAVPVPPSPVSARKKPLQFSGPARDARRVKIRPGTQVIVDGMPGELVDLSVGGAQAVVRQMVKPNYLVKLFFPTAAGQLICKGRIVWVLYEQPGTSLSVYRFGVKFSDVEAKLVEDFMRDYGEEFAQPHRASEIA
jgi:hypothetical protein